MCKLKTIFGGGIIVLCYIAGRDFNRKYMIAAWLAAYLPTTAVREKTTSVSYFKAEKHPSDVHFFFLLMSTCKLLSVYVCLVTHHSGAYSGFLSMKRLGIPACMGYGVIPHIKVESSQLYT